MPDYQIQVVVDVTLRRTITVTAPTEAAAVSIAEITGGAETDLSLWAIHEPDQLEEFKVQTTEVVG